MARGEGGLVDGRERWRGGEQRTHRYRSRSQLFLQCRLLTARPRQLTLTSQRVPPFRFHSPRLYCRCRRRRTIAHREICSHRERERENRPEPALAREPERRESGPHSPKLKSQLSFHSSLVSALGEMSSCSWLTK